ncbi:MAG TPA: hypothetical protein VHA82_14545 [Ramlibacter sp.]|uniref:hypothetical protein n=1 Tax=Ramlibacter sp. TaxID=1917967 RepID=UPI002CF83F0C|nr:hypothetical protein [Ramlibacter sp.]HVZ45026.1 hypothetical protein [Ramlibacter sp.]
MDPTQALAPVADPYGDFVNGWKHVSDPNDPEYVRDPIRAMALAFVGLSMQIADISTTYTNMVAGLNTKLKDANEDLTALNTAEGSFSSSAGDTTSATVFTGSSDDVDERKKRMESEGITNHGWLVKSGPDSNGNYKLSINKQYTSEAVANVKTYIDGIQADEQKQQVDMNAAIQRYNGCFDVVADAMKMYGQQGLLVAEDMKAVTL